MIDLETVRPEIERLAKMVRACYESRTGVWDPKTKTTRMERDLPLDADNLKDLGVLEAALASE